MRKKLFTVEDTFQIEGRGLIAVGKDEMNSETVISFGNLLIIVDLNGNEVKTQFLGFDKFSPPNFEKLSTPLPNLSKEDVPIGSTIYIEVE